MLTRDVVVVGGSAGGIDPLFRAAAYFHGPRALGAEPCIVMEGNSLDRGILKLGARSPVE